MTPGDKGTRRRGLVLGLASLILWVGACAIAYLGPGRRWSDYIDGIEPALAPTSFPVYVLSNPLGIVAVFVLVLAVAVTAAWVRALPAAEEGRPTGSRSLNRRRFLLGAALEAGGLVAVVGACYLRVREWFTIYKTVIKVPVTRTDPNPREAWKNSTIKSYRRLGRTGFMASDIGMGLFVKDTPEKAVAIARAAFDRGLNYIDASPDYNKSEEAIGAAIRGYRDQIFLATKFCTPAGHLAAGSSVGHYVEAVEGSLRRLQTDYIDLIHIHACNSVERLLDPAAHEAFDRLKAQGKVRFQGFSSHTPNLEKVAAAAIESDRFDVMMLAYHHGAFPNLVKLIDRAHAKDLGVVAMKTLRGAKHRGLAEFRDFADSYAQAAFKWVLSNPSVSHLVVTFSEPQHVDEYLAASGGRFEEPDLAILKRYEELTAGTHCLPHCGACLDSCPAGLPIHDILRYRMYFEDYGQQKRAMTLYSQLEKKADLCLGCPAPCLGACPAGVPVAARTRGAHELLTLSGS